MSDNTNLVAKSNSDSAGEKSSAIGEIQQAQKVQSSNLDSSNLGSINLTLGYYAVGELSIGRPENALFAYRLLNELEKDEMRWQLGQAFCALELNLLGEAQETLQHIQKISPQNIETEQQKLLERCTLRLEYMQKQQEFKKGLNHDPQSSSTKKDSRKVTQSKVMQEIETQGKETQGRETQGKVIPFPTAQAVV